MVNAKLAEWLKEGLKKGYSREQLKQEALKKGFSREEIEKALKEIKKEKSKRKIVWLILIVLALAVVVCILFFYLQPKDLRYKCVKREMSLCKALLTDDGNYCKKINSTLEKLNFSERDYAFCNYFYYLGKAFRTNDFNLCDNINMTYRNAICKAVSKKDAAFCNNIEDKETCKNFISAIINNDCSSLNEPQPKGLCLVMTTKNEKNCGYFTKYCYE